MLRMILILTVLGVVPSTCAMQDTVVIDPGQKLLERLILDAQDENRGKVTGGEMAYRIISKIGKEEPTIFDSTVRWDRNRSFWTFKVSDPTTRVTGAFHNAPLHEIRTEYAMRIKDRYFAYTAYTNILHESSYDEYRTSTIFSYFDVFPESLGSRCCFPFQSTGRPWPEMTGSNYAKLFENPVIKFERISNSVIRQTLTDPKGTVAITDFSLEFSGYPIRMDFQDGRAKRQNTISTFEWIKTDGATVLKKFRIVRGDISGGEQDARQIHEFEARSFRISKTELQFDLQALKSLLPKDTKVVDHIRQKSYPLDPTARIPKRLSEDALDRLGRDVQNEGFVKP